MKGEQQMKHMTPGESKYVTGKTGENDDQR